MTEKGFEAEINFVETPNYIVSVEKPLNLEKNEGKKVDINILKARAQDIEKKEGRKNIAILVFLLLLIASIGIYLST